MEPVRSTEPEAGIGQAPDIEEDYRGHQKVVLKRGKKEEFPVAVHCIPACMAEHPGADIQAAEEYKCA